MTQIHAIVWLDHREAHIASFSRDSSNILEVHSRNPKQRIHHKANEIGSGKAADDHAFFDEIAESLSPPSGVLIVGPGNAKNGVRHVRSGPASRPRQTYRRRRNARPSNRRSVAGPRPHVVRCHRPTRGA